MYCSQAELGKLLWYKWILKSCDFFHTFYWLTGHWRMWYSEAGNQRGCRTSVDTSWVIQTNWHWPPSGRLVVWASGDWENHVGKGCRSSYNRCIYQGGWFRVCTEVLGRGKLFLSESWFYHLLQVVRDNRNLFWLMICILSCVKVLEHKHLDNLFSEICIFSIWKLWKHKCR